MQKFSENCINIQMPRACFGKREGEAFVCKTGQRGVPLCPAPLIRGRVPCGRPNPHLGTGR